MKHFRKVVEIISAMALATLVMTSAYGQMGGGGMMGGGMMGGGMTGGKGMGSRDDNGYGSGTNGVRRDSPPAPYSSGSAPSGDLDLSPFGQLGLSRQQLGEISIIREELRDRQSNARRTLEAEQKRLRELYDSPQRDKSKIDLQFRRIEKLRREIFESTISAQDRIEAQLSEQQRQRLHRIAPRWNVGG